MHASLTLLAAFGAGIVSYLSPCILPLIPAYISIISSFGIDPDSPESTPKNKLQLLTQSLLFVLGFSLIFIILGLSASSLGSLLDSHQLILIKVSGAFVAVMGILLIISLTGKSLLLSKEYNFKLNLKKFKRFGSVVAGAAFAFGWTPCIGTVLASILAIAADKKSLATGAILLTSYSAGLAVPFILFSLILEQLTGVLNFFKKFSRLLAFCGGILMVALGILIFSNQLTLLNSTI